jgi:YidC/Oxa1 family membrane protein insertase
MNNIRLFLYALLGVVCFALYSSWQKDYPTKTETGTTATVVASATTPVLSTEQSAVPKGELANIANMSESRLVKVHTDTLDVIIDTLGGSIVQTKLLQYKALINKPEPVEVLNNQEKNLYIAQSGLIGHTGQGPDTTDKLAQYRVTQHEYTLQPQDKEMQVKLTWERNGIEVNKVFVFSKGHYDIKVNYEINNQTSSNWFGQFFAQLKKMEGAPEPHAVMQYNTFTGAAISSPDKAYQKISYKKMAEENLNRDIQGGWLAMQQRYFVTAWVPNKNRTYHYFTSATPEKLYTIGLIDNAINIPAGGKEQISTTLYSGPEITQNLHAVAPTLDLVVDYGWLWPISICLLWIMQHIFNVIGNWGWAIILVTLFVKIVFFKLSESSYRSMARMKDIAPKIQALKERYGNDKQKLSQATMEIYRKEKVNPLGGCLPILIQIPVFIGLYYVLVEAVQLRQAPFMLWIHDLSMKDPYYILPILMGLSMFVTQKLSPQSPDPMQNKMMMVLPIVFTFFFLQFPAGLVLYWFVNNCISALQQWYINRKVAQQSAMDKSGIKWVKK